MGELDTADKNIQSINSILQTVFEKATKAGGVTNQENLNAIAEELHGLNEEILQTMNARYGDKYLFSGSGNEEAPFTVDGGRLFFNGKAVDDYDKEELFQLTDRVIELKQHEFTGIFDWLVDSMSAISKSQVGDRIELDNLPEGAGMAADIEERDVSEW